MLPAFAGFMIKQFPLVWGMAVVADSPLFSALIAQNVSPQNRGSSLTIVTCIGFFITILSIQTVKILSDHIDAHYMYLFLAVGPGLGVISLLRDKVKESNLHG